MFGILLFIEGDASVSVQTCKCVSPRFRRLEALCHCCVSSKNQLDHGRLHGWAMDDFFSERWQSASGEAASGLGAARKASDLQGKRPNANANSFFLIPSVRLRPLGHARHGLASLQLPWHKSSAPLRRRRRRRRSPSDVHGSDRSAARSRSRGLSVSDPGSWTCSSPGTRMGFLGILCSCNCSTPASRNREASTGPHRS